jgi:phage terminase Nu1 subunit (DNA packaging protein)
MRNKEAAVPAIRLANRTQAAAFFGIALTTLDAWVRQGAPVRRNGTKGVEAEFDLRNLALWRILKDERRLPPGRLDYDKLHEGVSAMKDAQLD